MTDRATVLHDSAVPLERWSDPVRGEVAFRTLFGGDATATGALTAGLTEMAPGDWLGHHRHAPAEIYYVVAGEGIVDLGEEQQAVRAGSAVFIPGDLEHGIRNTGSEPLRFFYVFAVSSFADVDYRFSAESH